MLPIMSGLYLKAVNGAIGQFKALSVSCLLSSWRRCDRFNTALGEPENVAGFRYCLDVARSAPGTYADGTGFMRSNARYQITRG